MNAADRANLTDFWERLRHVHLAGIDNFPEVVKRYDLMLALIGSRAKSGDSTAQELFTAITQPVPNRW